MKDSHIQRLAQKRLETKANQQAVDALIAYINANPGVQNQDLIRKSMELGYDPRELISHALGSVKVDKTGANLSKPLEDVLNTVFEKDATPGERIVVDPSSVESAKGKKIASDLKGGYGYAEGMRSPGGIILPERMVVEDAKTELDKLRRTSTGGHELRHSVDGLVRPGFEPTTEASFKPGHHYGDIYEPSELLREVRGIPEAPQVAEQVNKASQKHKLRPSEFKRVAAVSGPAGALFQSLKDLYTDAPAKSNSAAQAKIAAAYEAMKHDPTNPEVQKAYQALVNETEQQFEDLQKNKGLKLSKIGGDFANPYKSSADLIKDVRENNHMAYFPTDDGFGAGGAADATQSNPLLKETRFTGPDGKPMKANDLFRVVHDYYGHVDGENKFGATGEERAYQNHRKMFSPEAQKALATETRGQNSWVNYGPFGESNRANPAETKYAEQKTGLLPSWATEDLEKIENPKMHRLHGISTVAARALGPLAIGSSIVPLAADVKEGKYNTALARAASYAAPVGAEDMTANLMQEAELRDKSPELFDPEYRKLLQRIGQKRIEQGKSPVVESFSGQPVDTSATEESDIENRIKALQNLKSQG